jgi:hypothetical protein
MNEEESILKQSLVLTGKLLGVSIVWVALVSIVVVAITGRAVGSMSSSGDKANTVETDARAQQKNPASPNPAKPNG